MQATHMCLLLACAASALRGQEEPTRLPLPDDLASIRADNYYGLYAVNRKIGWMRTTTGLEQRDGEEVFVSATAGEFRMMVLGIIEVKMA